MVLKLNEISNNFDSDFYKKEDEILELQIQIEKILECIDNTTNIEAFGDRNKSVTTHEKAIIEVSTLAKVLKKLTDEYNNKIEYLKNEYV